MIAGIFSIVGAIVCVVLGIGLGIGYNFLVIKKYPANKRKFGYVITVFLFFLITVIVFGIISVNSFAVSTIKIKTAELEQYFNDNHANNTFVRNGLNLNGLSGDVSKVDSSLNSLRSLLPGPAVLGMSKTIYNIVVDFAIKELRKKLVTAKNTAQKANNAFANENNVITVASLSNGVQNTAIKTANITCIVIAAIFVILFLMYIIHTIKVVKSEQKAE